MKGGKKEKAKEKGRKERLFQGFEFIHIRDRK